jgi:hypothetical protein
MAQTDEGSAAAWEPGLELDVREHIAGSLKTCNGSPLFELIGRGR